MLEFFDKKVSTFLVIVSGSFSLIVIAGLLWYGLGFRPAERFDEERLAPQRAEIRQNSRDTEAIARYRERDIVRREQYFRSRAKMNEGAYLLFVSLFVFVLSMRRLAALTEAPPSPTKASDRPDEEGVRNRILVSVPAVSLPLVAAIFVGIAVLREEEKASEPKPADGVVIVDGAAEAPPVPDHLKWPCFRGPTHQGVLADMELPLSWDGGKNTNILWKTKVPLAGQSSPIIWGENVFLTGGDKQARQVYCFDRLTGRLKWTCTIRSRAFLEEDFEPYEDTGLAAPTAATDGRRVYALFGSGELAAVDFSGRQVWAVWFGQPKSSYGLSASPFVHDGKLIVQIDQSSRKKGLSALYAIDPANGNTIWKTPRAVPSSWSSPVLIRTPEREEIVTSADPFVISYDPKSGQEIWRAKALDGVEVAPSPIYSNGFVYSVQEGAELSAIRTGGAGDVTETHVAWTFDEGLPDCASPVTDGNLLVMAAAGYGSITCVDVKTGKAVWTQEFDDMFWSSPTLVGTRVYFPDVRGKTHIFELSRAYKALGTGTIAEDLYTTPAFVDSRIYMRGKEHLYCIGVKGE